MYKKRKVIITFIVGGLTYGTIEILARGYTHWTMIVTGGLCFSLFYIINSKLQNKNILLKCLIAGSIITTFELLVGYIVNILFKLNVWDYSNLPYNFKGQICVLYSCIWSLFGIPMTYLANYIRAYEPQKKRVEVKEI